MLNNKRGNSAALPLDAPAASRTAARSAPLPDLLRPEAQNALRVQRSRRSQLLGVLVLVDMVALIGASIVAALVRYGVVFPDSSKDLLVVAVPLFVTVALHSGLYSGTSLDSLRKLQGAAIRTVTITLVLVSVIIFSLKIGTNFSRLMVLIFAVAAIMLIAAGRFLIWRVAEAVLDRDVGMELLIIDGEPANSSSGVAVVVAEQAGIWPDPSDPEAIARLAALSRDRDKVVVYCPSERREAWSFILKCLTVHSEVRVQELDRLRPLGVNEQNGEFRIVVSENPLRWYQATLKRGFDLLVTVAALPILIPVMLAAAIAIKLDSSGPVFFRQARIGLGNREFQILKFRSMHTNLQDVAASKLTEREDPRVTRVGRFLRKTSIDELPQILNVLKGDMSLVGPRPHAPKALAGGFLYWEVDYSYWHRHVVKPGITGLAQIRGYRGNTEFQVDLRNRLDADLEYLSSWSIWKDVQILFATLRVLAHPNAY
jgi:exopolysaccharide biosynthesis polyprenyl glycosylphosphotransferase